MRYVVIMAGGSGKRLWPLSRKGMPKQLLRLVGDTSLLRLAYDRVQGSVPTENILVCTGAQYAAEVRAEIPELSDDQILGEPEGRDSLNAVAWPAAVLAAADPDATVAMVTADQIMRPVEAFRDALDVAFDAVDADPTALVTFGVVPTSAHTGYGYLKRGAQAAGLTDVYRVDGFREKPDLDTAREYLADGNHWWNSGMFVWRAATLLEQLQRLVPDCHEIVTRIAAEPALLGELFGKLPKISIDYAVMEPVAAGRGTAHVLAVPLPVTWHDVGGFAALAEHLPSDDQGNSVEGRAVLLDARNNLVINRAADDTLVAVFGMEGAVVVHSGDAILVCSAAESERIKEIVALVENEAAQFA